MPVSTRLSNLMAVVRWLEDAVSALLTATADRSLAKVLPFKKTNFV